MTAGLHHACFRQKARLAGCLQAGAHLCRAAQRGASLLGCGCPPVQGHQDAPGGTRGRCAVQPDARKKTLGNFWEEKPSEAPLLAPNLPLLSARPHCLRVFGAEDHDWGPSRGLKELQEPGGAQQAVGHAGPNSKHLPAPSPFPSRAAHSSHSTGQPFRNHAQGSDGGQRYRTVRRERCCFYAHSLPPTKAL